MPQLHSVIFVDATFVRPALDGQGMRLYGSTSGYVGLAPAAAAGSTDYTLPAADGSASAVLRTDGSGNLSWNSDTVAFFDGTALDSASVTVGEDAGTAYCYVEKSGTGDMRYIFASVPYTLDCTPIASVALTAGTDAIPQINYVYVTESGGVLSLVSNTTGFPNGVTPYSPVCTVVCQSAASVAIDGPYKLHAWINHVGDSYSGHLDHINAKLRIAPATWVSGTAANALAVSAPDAYIAVDSGVVYQLHEHNFPAIDMANGDPLFIVNDPTTPYKRITTLDDITQDESGGSINNRWFPLVVWGSANEDDVDCKIYANLPSSTYSTQAAAEADSDNAANFTIPSSFTGCGFLIAKYILKGQNSGTWQEGNTADLRGLLPAVSPSGGTAITDHGALSGLVDDDHAQYALLNGRSGGQVLYGSTLDGENLFLVSTSHANRGAVHVGIDPLGYPLFAVDEPNQTISIGGQVPVLTVDGSVGTITAIAGYSPTSDLQMATKKYVDDNSVADHGALTGLSDDDHTQYALLAGRSAGVGTVGQTLYGSPDSFGGLGIYGSSNANVGDVTVNDVIAVADDGVGILSGFPIIWFGSTSGSTGFQSPATVTGQVIYTLPAADGSSGHVLQTNGTGTLSWVAQSGGVTDHGALSGLTDDDHAQYALLAGRSGGQTIYGGTAASDVLTLYGTSNATLGTVQIGRGLNLNVDEVNDVVVTNGGTKFRLNNTGNLGYVGFIPETGSNSIDYTIPNVDGNANQVLITDGSATLSWANKDSIAVDATAKTASFTAVAGNMYLVDLSTVTADLVLTFPSSPSVGDRFGVTIKSQNSSGGTSTAFTTRPFFCIEPLNATSIQGLTYSANSGEGSGYLGLWLTGESLTFLWTGASWNVIADGRQPMRCEVYKSTNTSVANLTVVTPTYDNSTYDHGGLYSTAGPVLKRDSSYVYGEWMRWTNNGTGGRTLFITTTVSGISFRYDMATNGESHDFRMVTAEGVARDIVQLDVFQTSGSTLNAIAYYYRVIVTEQLATLS